jgi:hypothetical protein
VASSGRHRRGDLCQNDAKRPFKDKKGAFVGAFAVLYVFAVVLCSLSLEKRHFLARLWVRGVFLYGLGALRCF